MAQYPTIKPGLEENYMDRFKRGFIAGILAGIIVFIIGLILYYLNLTDLLWMNFAAVMIFGRKPLLLGERVFAEIAVLFFGGLMGIVYAYLIERINSEDHLLKGFVFSETIWFSSFAITLLFDVPEFRIIIFKSSLVNFVLAAIWGLGTSEILHRIDTRKVT